MFAIFRRADSLSRLPLARAFLDIWPDERPEEPDRATIALIRRHHLAKVITGGYALPFCCLVRLWIRRAGRARFLTGHTLPGDRLPLVRA